MNRLPLQGILVLEFCQYLSGPSAGLRLADLGARVIKIENPKNGDLCRVLAIKDQWVGRDSLLFHTINRNKESYTANLKSELEIEEIKRLIAKADVLIHNFRPGIMEKLGLDFETLKSSNQNLIYAQISGYGLEGPWAKKPGQDLLVQALSGLMFTSGNEQDPPTPFGLAIADILCGTQLVQAILAALFARSRRQEAIKIDISLLESLIDFQSEYLTTYFASNQKATRSKSNNGHPLLGAPYGIYKTSDGFLALAMIPIADLQSALSIDQLEPYDQSMVFSHRNEIKGILAETLVTHSSDYWLKKCHQKRLWAAEVKNWKQLMDEDGFKEADLLQELFATDGHQLKTTRCPIRFDGQIIKNKIPAPDLGAETLSIKEEFQLYEK